MKKFKVKSHQIDNGKWAPCGALFDFNNDNLGIGEGYTFSSEYRFDTKDEADEIFRKHFIEEGYEEVE